jgi:hypothetical protein
MNGPMLRLIPFFWSVTVKALLTLAANRVIFRRQAAAAEPVFRDWLFKKRGYDPESICREIAERVTYVIDPWHGAVDYVAVPALTWVRRYGDCDDFAYLAAEAMSSLGYRAWIITYITWNLYASHTVCVIRIDCKYRVFDQGLHGGGFETLGDAADYTKGLLPPVMARFVRRYRGRVDLPGRIVSGRKR